MIMMVMIFIRLSLVSVGATFWNWSIVVIAGDHWPRARENLYDDNDDGNNIYDDKDDGNNIFDDNDDGNNIYDDNDDGNDNDDNDNDDNDDGNYNDNNINDCDADDAGTSCPLSLSSACIAPPMKPKFVPPWNLHNI